MRLAKRLLLAQQSPVVSCQVHDWTTRYGKWPLTNDESLTQAMWDGVAVGPLEISLFQYFAVPQWFLRENVNVLKITKF